MKTIELKKEHRFNFDKRTIQPMDNGCIDTFPHGYVEAVH
jgi:hypothetical protein